MAKTELPRHVGFIPDGNRRWATQRGMIKDQGYAHGIEPGVRLFNQCRQLGIDEISIFCFTQDNTKRPSAQKNAFTEATVRLASGIIDQGAAVLAVGDDRSAQFPHELLPFRTRQGAGMKVNLLVNYGWKWDIDGLSSGAHRSHDVSRVDMIVRWGGGRRLSGFLPIQSVYADIYVCDALWPDFEPQHFEDALAWFRVQDRTLGG